MLWKLKYQWDEPTGDKFSKQWNLFKENLETISTEKIPRRLMSFVPKKLNLLAFANASLQAYMPHVFIY